MARFRLPERWLGIILIVLGAVGLLSNQLLPDSPVGAPHSEPISVQSTESAEARPAQSPAALKPSDKPAESSKASPQSGNSKPEAVESAQPRTGCRVLTVYDGDTLACDLNADGKIQRPIEVIRLLGIDSPEMRYSRKNPTHGTSHPTDEPWAKESSQWLEKQAHRKIVYLEFDRYYKDRYGRTLAYVYTGLNNAVSLNEKTVAQGNAMVLFIGKNRLHEARLREAEAKARSAKRGLWGEPAKTTKARP